MPTATATRPEGTVLRSKSTGAQFVVWQGEPFPAEVLALVVEPADLVELARRPIFRCEDCGTRASAREMWSESEVGGTCLACGRAFFACDDCGQDHHPDDSCPAS